MTAADSSTKLKVTFVPSVQRIAVIPSCEGTKEKIFHESSQLKVCFINIIYVYTCFEVCLTHV